MKRAFSLLAALLVLCAARDTVAQTVDITRRDTVQMGIEEAMQAALRVSPEVGAAQADARFARARQSEARASRFLTTFNAQTAHSLVPGLRIPDDNTQPLDALYLNPDVRNDPGKLRPYNRIEVEIVQPLWTWGELSGSIDAARHGVEVEDAKTAIKQREVALRLGESYYGLLLANALQRLARETGSVVDRAKVEIQRLLDEGAEDVDYADLYQVQLTEQEYLRRVVEVREGQATALTALRRQLFLPEGAVFAPADSALSPIDFTLDSLEVYFDAALRNRAEMAQARAGLAAREALVRVAKSDYYPKLGLGISATYAYAAGRERQRNPYIKEPYLSRSVEPGFRAAAEAQLRHHAGAGAAGAGAGAERALSDGRCRATRALRGRAGVSQPRRGAGRLPGARRAVHHHPAMAARRAAQLRPRPRRH